ncbi:MAG TPA: ribosome maturation factor RimM [Rubrobacter sp.]|nr:ribosome maturation factor RimM [Rubrobacter sp.]
MEDLSDPVVIGVVVAPHGVRGTLRVRALGPGRHLREGTEPVVAGMRRRISAARQTPKGFLLDLEGVESRADAKPLGGEQLLLDREELDAPEEGEFYVADLVGLAAVNDAGEVVGTVADTFETAAHEILVVREVKKEQDLYLPFTLEHVPQVDLESGQIVVRPPEG